MAARRPQRTGSISARPGGRWLLRYDLPTDPLTGRRRRVSKVITGSKRDAQRTLADLISSSATTGPDVTLTQLLTAWRSTATHATGTTRNYDRATRLIPAHLATARARDVNPATIDRLYRALADDGTSVHAIIALHSMLSAAYAQAEKWWDLRSPIRRVTPPTPPRARRNSAGMASFDPALLLAAAPTYLDRAWLALHLSTGARRSEILALRWSDLDLDAGVVTIAEALDPTGAGRKTTKTGDVRQSALDAATVAIIRHWRTAARERALAAGAIIGPDAYVISWAPDSATPWRPDYATKRYARIAADAGIVGVTLHGLRHAMGSLLIGAGIDPKTVQTRLGHARASTTMDTYARSMPARDRDAADVIGRIIHGS